MHGRQLHWTGSSKREMAAMLVVKNAMLAEGWIGKQVVACQGRKKQSFFLVKRKSQEGAWRCRGERDREERKLRRIRRSIRPYSFSLGMVSAFFFFYFSHFELFSSVSCHLWIPLTLEDYLCIFIFRFGMFWV